MPTADPDRAFAASLPWAGGVNVVRTQGGLVAVCKPEGIRSHPNEGGRVDEGALLRLPFDLKRESYLLPDGKRMYLLHRIDAPTSGLLLLTADADLAVCVKNLFAKHEVHKTYAALVFGDAGRGTRTWRDRLRTDHSGGTARTSAGSVGEPAVTDVKVVGSRRTGGVTVSLLTLKPATGRTHQLRVQCAARRLPIVGDATYGDFRLNRVAAKDLGIKRLCLHAQSIRLEAQFKGAKFAFETSCELPEVFRIA